MFQNVSKSFLTGLRRNWKLGFARALSAIGAVWLVTEICLAAWPSAGAAISENRSLFLAFNGVLAAIALFWTVYEPRRVSFTIPTTATKLTILFGNIFDQSKDDWVIPVNEFFDYQLGHIVSPTSVHGGFIQSVYNGDGLQFRNDIDRVLDEDLAVPAEGDGHRFLRYPIGTTVRIPMGNRIAIVSVTSTTDLQTSKASTTVDRLWISLEKILLVIRDYSGGRPVSLPLIGNGRANLNLKPQHLLRLIVLSIVTFARREGLGSDISIVVPDACFEHLDLREIKKDWTKDGL